MKIEYCNLRIPNCRKDFCRECCINKEVKIYSLDLILKEIPVEGIRIDEYLYNPWFPHKINLSLLLKRKSNGECYFLNENGCSIYEKKPMVCDLYPGMIFNYLNELYFSMKSCYSRKNFVRVPLKKAIENFDPKEILKFHIAVKIDKIITPYVEKIKDVKDRVSIEKEILEVSGINELIEKIDDAEMNIKGNIVKLDFDMREFRVFKKTLKINLKTYF